MDSYLRPVIQTMIRYGVIEGEDEEVYIFGLKSLLIYLVNIFTVIIIGWSMGMLGYGIVMLLAIMLLRSYAGGYHAPNFVSCYILSSLSVVAILYIQKHIVFPNIAAISVLLAADILIWAFAPLPDQNRPLTNNETIVYRKIARIILVAESILALIFIGLENDYGQLLISTICLCAIGFLAYLFKRSRHS